MEATIVSSPSTEPCVIDCCDASHADVCCSEDSNGQQQQLHVALRSLEGKFEVYFKNIQAEFNVKCESYDKTIAELSKELSETKAMIRACDNSHPKVTDAKMIDHIASLSTDSSSMDGSVDLPRILQFDKEDLRRTVNSDSGTDGSGGNVEGLNRSQEPVSSYEETTTIPASIERMIFNELRSHMKGINAERETHSYLLQQEIEKQNQQIAQLRVDVMSGLRVLDLNVRHPKDLDQHPIPLHTMKFDDTEVEIELLEEGKFSSVTTLTQKNSTRSKPKNQLSLVQTIDDPLVQFTSRVCNKLIQDETERLMTTWGTHFDDLTIYLQDHLDKQSDCIAESRKLTFEHIDAETQARTGVLNAQLNYLGRKNQQQEKAMQEVRDEQERSFLVIVETLIKLKTKFEGIGEKLKHHEEMQLASEIDITLLRQEFTSESVSCTSKFSQYESKLRLLKCNVDHMVKEVETIIEDRESIPTILSATIELFNSRMETNDEKWNAQLSALENRFHNQIESGQMQIQKMNQHKREMEVVVTAICKKLVDLTADISEKQGIEVEDLLSKCRTDENFGKHGDGSDHHFKYIKVDQKKYKKALWCARQQRGKLLENSPKNEIEFYDLTFAETKSIE